MRIERVPCSEIVDHQKIKNLVCSIAEKRNFLSGDKKLERNKCLDWNQKLAMELRHQYRIPCKIIWVKRKNNILPPQHPAVENGYIYHCFVELKNTDLIIDLTYRQFNKYIDEILFLSRNDIFSQGWEEEKN